MNQSDFGIFHTFVASSLLTNTSHSEAFTDLQHIAALWFHDNVQNSEDYMELTQEAGSEIKSNGEQLQTGKEFR